MADIQDALQNPFSQEKAWLTFQEHLKGAARLREEIRQGLEDGTASDRELTIKAADALGRLTDNTILERVIRQALEGRDSQ